MKVPWALTVLVLTGLLSACGSDNPPDVSRRAAGALHAVEPDLERLAQAVRAADPRDKASLVDVQAAARRASESLTDTRSELRSLLETGASSDDAARALRRRGAAVADLQDLADALASTRLSAPRIEAAYARALLAIDDLRDDLDVPAINANVLAEDLRQTRDDDARQRRSLAAARERRRRDNAQTGQPSAPVGGGSSGSAGGSVSYVQYTGPAFAARVPTGTGWGSPSSSAPTPGRLFRTNVRGPGGLFVIIDYTPFEPATFGGRFSSRSVVGQTAFGSAVRYQFQGGRIPECQRQPCTDYIINDPATHQGFGVLAGGGPSSSAIAQVVAESVVPLGE